MKQAADGKRFAERVVASHRGPGLEHFGLDAVPRQDRKRFGRDAKPPPHSERKHHSFGAVGDQVFDVCGLNAGDVPGSGFAPVPLTCAAGEEFGILEGGETVDVDTPPSEMPDKRRDLNARSRMLRPRKRGKPGLWP